MCKWRALSSGDPWRLCKNIDFTTHEGRAAHAKGFLKGKLENKERTVQKTDCSFVIEF